MPPLIFIDLETTGLDAGIAAPISIAAVVLSGPHHDKLFHRRFRPFAGADVNPYAMAANGYDELEIWTWPSPAEACSDFTFWINEVCPAPDIVTPAGWNYAFDERFLKAWISRHIDDAPAFYGNTFSPDYVEGMSLVKEVFPDHATRFPRKGGMKLTYQYEYHFGVPLRDAHTELADCHATRRIFLKCDSLKAEPQYKPYHNIYQ